MNVHDVAEFVAFGREEDVGGFYRKVVFFHDLRHAGNIWASKAGTSTKDLMARMGHDDMRAALIYQRATSDADAQIADRLSKLVDKHRKGTTPDDDDPDGQLVPVG